MPLNKSTGNMYDFITHTWNTIKGKCPHGCSYCYMKRWGKQPPLHFDEKELKTKLGIGNFIFIGSSCDMFASNIKEDWIFKTLFHISLYPYNKYLFQTKNPARFADSFSGFDNLEANSVFCTTLESNRDYPAIRQNSPIIQERVQAVSKIPIIKYITIEPIIDFDLLEFVELIKRCNPAQVNIGADSNPNRNKLPEPPKEKILELIAELETFTKVVQKKNLKRLLK